MRDVARPSDWTGELRRSYALWTLVALLAAAFFLGGSSREDAATLIVLRPLSAVALAVALMGIKWSALARFPALVIGAVAAVAIVVIHLIPLPPSLWMALPGRELAAEAARLGGSADVWRPLTLVPWRGWNALFALVAPLAALLLAMQCDARQRGQLLFAVLALMGASVLVAAVQAATGYSAGAYIYRINSINVATGLFANRNHFAVMLCCTFPMLAFVALRSTGGGRNGPIWLWLAGVAGIVMLFTLLLTGSRSGVVLSVVALLSLPLIYQPRRYLAIAVGVLTLVLLVAVAVYLSRAEAIDRLLATDDKEEVRLYVWQPIADMAKLYFPFGSGIGSFVEVFEVGETRDLLKFTYLNHAHNDWLEYALEAGLAGILLMAAGLLSWITGAVRLFRMPADRDGRVHLGRVGAVAILLLGLASLVDYPVRVPAVACVAAIAAVWMASGIRGGKLGTNRVVRWSELAATETAKDRGGSEGNR